MHKISHHRVIVDKRRRVRFAALVRINIVVWFDFGSVRFEMNWRLFGAHSLVRLQCHRLISIGTDTLRDSEDCKIQSVHRNP